MPVAILRLRGGHYAGNRAWEALRETPAWFRRRGTHIAGTLHLPRRRGRVPGVLLCHGFTGTKVETRFLFVKMARAFARRGIAAYRFDFRGSGESGGDFRAMTISGEIEDARAAFRFLGRHRGLDRRRLGVLGLSLGGCVAAHVATRERAVRSLALWAAVARPRATFSGGRREDLGGLRPDSAFFRDAQRIDPCSALSRGSRRFPVLVAHGSGDDVVPVGAAEAYFSCLHHARYPVRKYILDGADHTFSRCDWEDRIISATVNWFELTLR